MAIEAWFVDESRGDQSQPHHRDPKEFVSTDRLAELGFLYWKLDPSDFENDEELRKIRVDRGYSYLLMRLFVGKPVWTAYNRPQEDHPARKEYVKCLTEKVGPGVRTCSSLRSIM